MKDLIDDNEESEGEDSDASGEKKRKKSDDEDYDDRLEDEDYDLIEENLGVRVERVSLIYSFIIIIVISLAKLRINGHLGIVFQKRFKRLRRIQDEESEDEGTEHQVEEERDAIANELFEGGSGDVSLIAILAIIIYCSSKLAWFFFFLVFFCSFAI